MSTGGAPSPTIWKRVGAAVGGLTAVLGLIIAWRTAELPRLAWADDLVKMETNFSAIIKRLEERIDKNDLTLLYRERDRVENKIDTLEQRYARNPDNAALRELIRDRERERDGIDRQIDALTRFGPRREP